MRVVTTRKSIVRPSALPFPSLGAAREFKESRKEEEGEIQKEMGRRGVASYVPCCLLAANAFRATHRPTAFKISACKVASSEVGYVDSPLLLGCRAEVCSSSWPGRQRLEGGPRRRPRSRAWPPPRRMICPSPWVTLAPSSSARRDSRLKEREGEGERSGGKCRRLTFAWTCILTDDTHPTRPR